MDQMTGEFRIPRVRPIEISAGRGVPIGGSTRNPGPVMLAMRA